MSKPIEKCIICGEVNSGYVAYIEINGHIICLECNHKINMKYLEMMDRIFKEKALLNV